jgi:hypothetical protein
MSVAAARPERNLHVRRKPNRHVRLKPNLRVRSLLFHKSFVSRALPCVVMRERF